VLEAASRGEIRALYVMGANPVVRYPNAAKVEQALNAVEFLVVQDLFLTETAARADVVLPALTVAEKNGTLTNVEGRVQRFVRAMDPLGAGKPDWWILNGVASRMGQSLGYGSVETIVADIRKALAQGDLTQGHSKLSITGIEYEPPSAAALGSHLPAPRREQETTPA